jgi:hypothetical protein
MVESKIVKKGLIVLGLAFFVAGLSFAQPKNTLTVDFGPTIAGLGFGAIGNIAGNILNDADLGDFNSTGIGIGAQYERQFTRMMSAAVRFAYLGAGMNLSAQESLGTATAAVDFNSFSVEGHARVYPFMRTLFLDAMLGYGNLSTKVDGRVNVTGLGVRTVDFTATRNYIKLGGKAGWRIDFGAPGGLVLETAFGYYHSIGLGDSIMKQISREIGGTIQGIGDEFELVENFVFIGGPRVTLALGWRF